jgi:glutaredoxin 3
MAKTVIVYNQPGWGPCHKEKEFLSQKGIEFVDKNVRADPAALKELLDMGYQSTPVTIIDGEAVVGFDQQRIMVLLGISAWPSTTETKKEILTKSGEKWLAQIRHRASDGSDQPQLRRKGAGCHFGPFGYAQGRLREKSLFRRNGENLQIPRIRSGWRVLACYFAFLVSWARWWD